jgi:hypothetical protein
MEKTENKFHFLKKLLIKHPDNNYKEIAKLKRKIDWEN